jgi:hypothetical protein
MTSWVDTTLPASVSLQGLAYGNGRFVAVSLSNNKSFYSLDGETWVAGGNLPATRSWHGAGFGNGLFVALGMTSGGSQTNTVATSPDGVTWTARSIPNDFWWEVEHNGTLFLAVALYANRYATSPDGITWTGRTFPSPDCAAIACSDSVTCAILQRNPFTWNTATSADGISWTLNIGAMPPGVWFCMTWNGSVFCAVDQGELGTSTRCATSPDGVTWTEYATLPDATWDDVTSDPVTGRIFAVAFGADISAYSDDDGATWTQSLLPAASEWRGVVYGGGGYVAVSRTTGTLAAQFYDDPTTIDFWGNLIGTTQS